MNFNINEITNDEELFVKTGGYADTYVYNTEDIVKLKQVFDVTEQNENTQTGGSKESHDIKNYADSIYRKKINSVYQYFYVKSDKPISKQDLDRIKNLKIPPAWIDVWISSDPKSDIQVIGTDTKGRKQYKYHEKHIANAEKEKFLRLQDFIKSIPDLDNIMKTHKMLHIYNKYHVITTMLGIVKEVHMRAGKEQYVRENKSYGISSLRKKHVSVSGDTVMFRFKGKSRKQLSYSINDAEIAEHIKALIKLTGEHLFQFIDESDNKIKNISSDDLNKYIQDFMGQDFTIKDFRTYAANFIFVKAVLSETKKRTPSNQKVIKKNLKNAIKTTAFYLRHTANISKKSYIMGFCVELYTNNPAYFIERKYHEPISVLSDILKLYKSKILHM